MDTALLVMVALALLVLLGSAVRERNDLLFQLECERAHHGEHHEKEERWLAKHKLVFADLLEQTGENDRLRAIVLAILDEGQCLAADGKPEIPEQISGQFCLSLDLARELVQLLSEPATPPPADAGREGHP